MGALPNDPTTPAEHALPTGDAGIAVLAFWDGGYRRLPLVGSGVWVVGRAEECEVRIDHTSVSRQHLKLHVGEAIHVEDLGSFNGSRLNGTPLAANQKKPVSPGDVVELGSAVLIVQHRTSAVPAARVGERQGIERLERLVELVAQSRINVLVLGETGAGKEVTAMAIHARSPRADRSFVGVNCAALPETLLEAELFGFERGAFTSADRAKPGLLESADGGTFLLDEVAELPLPTQAKLLRVIERREVQRLGSVEPRTVDVRFIAATHQDLSARAREGHFREDLLYRLNGISIVVPPLRERAFQIRDLAQTFVQAAASEIGRPPVAIGADALALLERHDWPGNIRELKNVIDRAVLLSGGSPIHATHIQLDAGVETSRRPLGRNALREDYQDFERHRISAALEQSAGNQTEAAKILGISRRTLMNRLDALGLPRPRKRTR